MAAEDRNNKFREYYEDKDGDWGGGSGAGSDPFYNIPYRMFLESFIKLNHVKSIVDVGCGDWVFSQYLDYSSIRYRGYDVVESVITRNSQAFGSDTVTFEVMPDRLFDIPSADLLIMKDVLQHIPDADIMRFKNELFSRFPVCLLTNSFIKINSFVNTDIEEPGEFRCLDLNDEPYNFGGQYLLEFSTPLWEKVRTLLYIPK